jgi:hypothetical protein
MTEAALIDAIFTAADDPCAAVKDERLRKAVNVALLHAYAEGRKDEREEWVEKAMRAMNETGQGEHGFVVTRHQADQL